MSDSAVPNLPIASSADVDRYFYVSMAALFVATAVVSFAPTSSALIAAVASGQRPAPPAVLHVHAVAMSAWLALLLVQTSLVATARTSLHRRLGILSVVVAPVMLFSMVMVTVGPLVFLSKLTAAELTRFGVNVDGVWGFLTTQIRAIVLFPLFVVWSLRARRADLDTHKRMMLLATVVVLGAAFGRLVGSTQWLPGRELFATHLVPDLYQLTLLLPGVIYDVMRRGAVHRAYVIGAALLVVTMLAAHFVATAGWWLAIGRSVIDGAA